jgi:aldehyde:ferredoxin oxidoreductase
MDVTHALGALPTRNFSLGRFVAKDSINGKALHDTIQARGGEGRVSPRLHARLRHSVFQYIPRQQGKALCYPGGHTRTWAMLGSNWI